MKISGLLGSLLGRITCCIIVRTISCVKRCTTAGRGRRGVLVLLACLVCLINVVRFQPPEPPRYKLWLRNATVDIRQLLKSESDRNYTDFMSDSLEEVEAWQASRRSVFARTNIDCAAMFSASWREFGRAMEFMKTTPRQDELTPNKYLRMTQDCDDFKRKRGYLTKPESKVEADFPIAFNLLLNKNFEQAERLLRAIYVPQNFYCIHLDAKTTRHVRKVITAIVACFENVVMASRSIDVTWGHMSIMEAEMICLQQLLEYKWKYFINLSGRMFPAHTNAELVQILKLYDGANDVEGRLNPQINFDRHTYVWAFDEKKDKLKNTALNKSAIPYRLDIYKGSNQVALTRAFVVFFLYSPMAQDVVEWFADTQVPDEHIWPTINHNQILRAPGGYKGDPETKPFNVRATIWDKAARQKSWSWKNYQCQSGNNIRMICQFGVKDLPWLQRRPELFVNKFYIHSDWLAYDCMEELIFNRTADVIRTLANQKRPKFDLTYHLNLPFVKQKSRLVISMEDTEFYPLT